MAALMLTVLGMSLLGSLHCAGMCGALVAFACGAPEPGRSRTGLHVLYHGGRLVMYCLIGALCGLAGAAFDIGGALVGVQRAATFTAGGVMILFGIVALLQHTNFRMPHFQLPGPINRWVMQAQRGAATLKPAPRAATIGLLSGLLPCGWLWFFALMATGTGNPLWGAAVMAAFWLGTVPVLLSVGVGTQWLARWLGKAVPVVTSVAIIIVGLFTLTGMIGMSPAAFAKLKPVEAKTTAESVEQVIDLGSQTPPCCQHHGE